MERASPLQEAWLDLLGIYPWQWFGNFTFADHVHPERANKCWRVFISKLNRSLYGRNWKRKDNQGVAWVRAIEYQKRGVIHFHALLADIKDMNHTCRRLTWMDEWEALAGYARIYKPASVEDCTRYVTKYVIKDGEIDVSDNLERFRNIKDMLNKNEN